MILLLLDTDPTNPTAARVSLDDDYQAEMWVTETASDPKSQHPDHWVVTWELSDDQGPRARWERPQGDTGCPKLVHTEPRYTGTDWRLFT